MNNKLTITELRKMIKEEISDRNLIRDMQKLMKSNRPQVAKYGERNEYDQAIASRLVHLLELLGSRDIEVEKQIPISQTLQQAVNQIAHHLKAADSKIKFNDTTNSYLVNSVYQYLEDQKPEQGVNYSKRKVIDKEIAEAIVTIIAIAGARSEFSDRKYNIYQVIYKFVGNLENRIESARRIHSHGGGFDPATADIRFG